MFDCPSFKIASRRRLRPVETHWIVDQELLLRRATGRDPRYDVDQCFIVGCVRRHVGVRPTFQGGIEFENKRV